VGRKEQDFATIPTTSGLLDSSQILQGNGFHNQSQTFIMLQ